MANKGK
ncbi:hypothetical protein M8C21_012215 [Ambrosia artemisiifolia]|nr:hypothetical protein M8C21_012215 [Ambrosia artemisiifolia]